ncbi:MAG: FAD-dependent oxidoreductase [Eubacteriales bacterium]|nr:FAD-dependent oxidoreductase [Eubacteriales bacterium]
MLDLMIIGAGPAGLSAAVYAQRAALDACVLEQYTAGGQIAEAVDVENYPGIPSITGAALAQRMEQHAKVLGSTLQTAEVVSLIRRASCWDAICANGQTVSARAVIAATGTMRRKLHVPGEDTYTGRGVSYCATCDGFFFKGKTVAVVGGGDTAVDDAIFLSEVAERIYLVHRRDSLRASPRRQEKLRQKTNVTILWDCVVTEICGDKDHMTALHVKQKNGTCPKLLTDGVFIAVGAQPKAEYLPAELLRDAAGYVPAAEDGRTNLPGLFVSGDLRAKTQRQAITAAADGACAVASVEQYLREM